MKRKINGITALILASCILISCGKKPLEVPELIESVAGNESYRPVEYMDIGTIDAMYGEKAKPVLSCGTVVPKEDAYFFTSRVKLKEICVRIGDEVSEGQVLARVNTESVNDNIVELREKYQYEIDSFEQEQKIYEIEHEAKRIDMLSKREFKEDEDADKLEDELKVMEENNRFDVRLHELKLSQINDQIAEEQKLLEGHDLVARKSGTVTFVKDLKSTNIINSCENVVVLADKNETYIELSSCNLTAQNKKYLKNYDRFYTYVNGVRHELNEYSYTPEELALADNKRVYPCERFVLDDPEVTPAIGENLLIYMTKNVKEHVLAVGNDSLFSDESGDFVYVLEDGKKIIKHVKLGNKSDHYTEVVSGLEEGELVFYTTNTYILKDYVTETVKLTDFTVNREIEKYKVIDSEDRVFYSEYEGIVESVLVNDSKTVEKGDLIATIKLNEGGAQYAALAYDVENVTANYDRRIRDLENARKELAKTYKEMDDAMDMMGFPDKSGDDFTEQDLRLVYAALQIGAQIDTIDEQMKLAKIDHDYQLGVASRSMAKTAENNDGHGVISVYAACDGEIGNMKLKENANVEIGDRMFDIEEPSEMVLSVNTNSISHMGQTVKMTGKDSGKTYKGTIMGGPGLQHNVYLTELKGRMYVSVNTPDMNKIQYYVRFEDDDFYKTLESCSASFDDYVFRDIVVIPRKALYTETVVNKESNYVWRVIDGRAVKQYVSTIKDDNALNTVVCVTDGLKEGDVIAMENGGVN
ncbi:MAG: efflux RND transporter periplasmic adaptor subunit [Lachnospiraceae bacterium]|nr:efflux RND transporter periplasmic adaptor subunit [Lachnospiraceae bacterium]